MGILEQRVAALEAKLPPTNDARAEKRMVHWRAIGATLRDWPELPGYSPIGKAIYISDNMSRLVDLAYDQWSHEDLGMVRAIDSLFQGLPADALAALGMNAQEAILAMAAIGKRGKHGIN